ncbi:MAG: lipid II flippase MurJ, partial [Thermoguttaceae bacterium]
MKPNRKIVLKGTLITSIGTLISRVLGMLRDSATAAMLGMTAGGIMDSFVLAFRLPDITRRMFGEGSLSVGFIPVFARLWHSNRAKAWKLVSAYLTGIFFLLLIIVLLGEGICLLGYTLFPPESKVHVAAKLTSLMLPYLILICLAAIAAASLQTLGKFFVPSLIPTILNICWLFGIVVLAPRISSDPLIRCYVLTGCILVAGVIQFGIQMPLLYKLGFQYTTGFNSIKKEAFEVGASFFPTMIGLMATQFNVLVASSIAWLFSGEANQ